MSPFLIHAFMRSRAKSCEVKAPGPDGVADRATTTLSATSRDDTTMLRRSLVLASAVALALAPSARACAAHGNLDAASLDAALAASAADDEAASAAAATTTEDVVINAVGGCGCGGLGRNNAAPRTRGPKGDGFVEEILAPGDASDAAAAWRAANTVMIPAGRFHMGTDVDGIKGDGEGANTGEGLRG